LKTLTEVITFSFFGHFGSKQIAMNRKFELPVLPCLLVVLLSLSSANSFSQTTTVNFNSPLYVTANSVVDLQGSITGVTPAGSIFFDAASIEVVGGLQSGDNFDLDASHTLMGSLVSIDTINGVVNFEYIGLNSQVALSNDLGALKYVTGSPGVRTIKVTITNGTSVGSTVIEVIVQANQPPTFSLETTTMSTLWEDGPSGSFTGVVTNISPGLHEDQQHVSLLIDAFDHTIFSNISIDPAGNLSYALLPDANGTGNVSIYAQDDGGTAWGGIEKSAVAVLPVMVAPVNDAPKFSKGSDISIATGSGAQNIVAWATNISPGPSNESTQTIHFEVTGFDPAFFAAPPAIDAQGTLSFAPAPGAVGQTTATVVVKDDGGTDHGGVDQSTSQSFVISISPNTPPTFTAGADQNVFEDAGPQQVKGWATQIAAGVNESLQNITFQLSGYNENLFAEEPSIDPQGNLTFTSASNAFGTTTVTVQALDDGGTANGGIDHSTVTTFNISIQPVNDAPTMDPVSTQHIVFGAPSQTMLLTGISAGPKENSQNVSVNILSTGSAIDNVRVVYDGGNSATLTYTITGVGTSTVSVILTDDGGTANGGIDRTTYTFDVLAEGGTQFLFVPTVFSPNGDSSNDTFRIRGASISTLQMAVFDLSGKQIYYTSDVNAALERGWDGTYNGNAVPAGSYVWTINGNLADGSELFVNGKKYGQVLLVR
jgi:gliding motility-associated-like protein